jgi:hypothetical protein
MLECQKRVRALLIGYRGAYNGVKNVDIIVKHYAIRIHMVFSIFEADYDAKNMGGI